MSGDEKLRGIANLFERDELKKFISSYLIMMGVVEGFVFFASWISYIWSEGQVFPWKAFIISAFTTPIAITFIFAVIIVGFNKYMYEKKPPAEEALKAVATEGETKPLERKFMLFINSLRQVPFLIALLLLVISAGIIYKLDAIALFIANAGERAAQYLFISLAVVLGVATVIGLVWMFLSYNLRKQKLEYQFKYRQEVMDKLGLVILDDDTIVDREGQMITRQIPGDLSPGKKRDEDITLIPRLPNR